MTAFDASTLIVLRATQAEVAEHEKVLEGIDIQSKGGSLRRRLVPQG